MPIQFKPNKIIAIGLSFLLILGLGYLSKLGVSKLQDFDQERRERVRQANRQPFLETTNRTKTTVRTDGGRLVDPVETFVYFWRTDCDDCDRVAKFLAENKVSERLNLSSRLVDTNQTNLMQMKLSAEECRRSNDIEPPFLFAKGKCYFEVDSIKSFLNSELEQLDS